MTCKCGYTRECGSYVTCKCGCERECGWHVTCECGCTWSVAGIRHVNVNADGNVVGM